MPKQSERPDYVHPEAKRIPKKYTFSTDIKDQNADEILNYILSRKEEGINLKDMILNIEYDDDSYVDSIKFIWLKFCWETNKEVEDRLNYEKKLKQQQEANKKLIEELQYEQYLQLKKKYEPNKETT